MDSRLNDDGVLTIREGVILPVSELTFRFSRSGGPGGQNVNKVSTRVELFFDLRGTTALSDEVKSRLLDALGPRLTAAGVLRVVADRSRSQWRNRQDAVETLVALLGKAFVRKRKRISTLPTPAARERRLARKKQQGDRKRQRTSRSREDEA